MHRLPLIGTSNRSELVTAKLSREEIARIVSDVRDLGFDRLESHSEKCKVMPNGKEACFDAPTTVIRIESKVVLTHAGFSNDPTVHDAIRNYLVAYTPPKHATPYRLTSGVTKKQVLAVRDDGVCTAMEPRDARDLERQRGYADLDPERVWEQWQLVRPPRT